MATHTTPEPPAFPTQCSICIGPYADPVSIPCGHIFCSQCVGSYLRSNGRRCPNCRATFSGPIPTSRGQPSNGQSDIRRVYIDFDTATRRTITPLEPPLGLAAANNVNVQLYADLRIANNAQTRLIDENHTMHAQIASLGDALRTARGDLHAKDVARRRLVSDNTELMQEKLAVCKANGALQAELRAEIGVKTRLGSQVQSLTSDLRVAKDMEQRLNSEVQFLTVQSADIHSRNQAALGEVQALKADLERERSGKKAITAELHRRDNELLLASEEASQLKQELEHTLAKLKPPNLNSFNVVDLFCAILLVFTLISVNITE